MGGPAIVGGPSHVNEKIFLGKRKKEAPRKNLKGGQRIRPSSCEKKKNVEEDEARTFHERAGGRT